MATHLGDTQVGAEPRDDVISGEELKPTARNSGSSHIELLLKTVESELIPRLFVNHMMDVPSSSPLVENHASAPISGPWSSQESVARFADLCIGNDPALLDRHITDLLAAGVSLESIFLNLLAPAATELGERWLEDRLSFVDVQLGLCRLHQLICECETIGYHSENLTLSDNSIILTCAPGDDHTFGVTMVADFFRRYGWQVSNLCGLESSFITARLASTAYSVAGFSLHNEYNYDALAVLIAEVKNVSINNDIIIMVGGDFFINNPDKVAEVGAHVFASDGREAIANAEKACSRRGRPVL